MCINTTMIQTCSRARQVKPSEGFILNEVNESLSSHAQIIYKMWWWSLFPLVCLPRLDNRFQNSNESSKQPEETVGEEFLWTKEQEGGEERRWGGGG